MSKHIAIYCRVSSKRQDLRSQLPDLKRFAAVQELPVQWYEDKATGKTMDRPGWAKLEVAMRAGKTTSICCWRLDRLGRSAKQLTSLFEELQQRRVNLVSLKEGIDLSTPAGRMMANVLASLAQYETELRAERVLAGQEAARAKGLRWGGSRPGRRKATPDQMAIIRQLHAQQLSINRISKAVGLARPTIARLLAD
jgi:DNA invertase Pin-like site-specific DNA recombinase